MCDQARNGVTRHGVAIGRRPRVYHGVKCAVCVGAFAIPDPNTSTP